MIIAGLQRSTLIDYPEKLACIIYLAGCNFRCPWCYSSELVLPLKIINQPRFSEKEIFDFLAERKGLLDGVVICGGEPTINKDLPKFIEKIKRMGFAVKLDTNGSNPKMLKELVDLGMIDYVAMDIKCGLNYVDKLSSIINPNHNAAKLITKIRESIAFLNSTIGRTEFSFEFRTTLYPPLVQEQDIIDITKEISPKSVYYLQQFRARKGLLGGDEIANIEPYDDVKLEQLITIARERVPNTQLRYI